MSAMPAPTAPFVTPTVTCWDYNGKLYELDYALYSATIDLLFEKSVVAAARFIEVYGDSPKKMTIKEQVESMNRFWNDQLGFLDIDTIEVRTHLIPDGTIDDWARHFKTHVVPVIVANELPKRPGPVAVILPSDQV